MVVLILLNNHVEELVWPTQLTESTATVTEQLTTLYNTRNELLALITCCKQLIQSVTDQQNNSTLNDLMDTATVYISTEQAKRRVTIHTHQLQQHIDNIVQQLQSLPADTLQQHAALSEYIADTHNKQPLIDALNEYTQQTSNTDDVKAVKLFNTDTATLWFANKPLQRSDATNTKILLSKYLGSNEKSIVKVKLTNTASTQPTRTADVDAETRQAMMSYYQKQQKAQEQLQHAASDSHSAAFNPNALKNAIHGFSTVSYKT